MLKLHPVQERLLFLLKANHESPLTVRELQEELQVSSPSVVQHHILQLEKKGYLRRNPTNPRDYQVLSDSPDKLVTYLNLYGMAQCGPKGSLLDGDPIDRVPISTKILGFPSSEAFMIKARGDSMQPMIKEGDLVIVKKTSDVNDSQIAVCVNNGEVLIKKIQRIKDRNRVRYNLISLNDDYQPFLADENFKIEGIVRSVLNYTN
jgi:repressor LexA